MTLGLSSDNGPFTCTDMLAVSKSSMTDKAAGQKPCNNLGITFCRRDRVPRYSVLLEQSLPSVDKRLYT